MQKYGVAIIGTGWVSDEYVKAFQKNPHTEVRAIQSHDKSRAEAKIAEHRLADCAACTDLKETLARKGIDIAVICSRHHYHAEQGIAAARAGKHVVIEKPIALDLKSLRALDEAIRATGVKSVVSFVLRWNPMFDNVRAMLDQGLIGDIFYAEVDYMHGIGPWYGLWEWHVKKEFGGSALLTAGCHAVDGLRWFVRDEAVEVTACSNRSKRNPLQYEYDPNVVTIIRFAGGAIGKAATTIECRMPYVFNVQLFGDKGTIRNNQVFSTSWPGQKGFATVPTILPDSGDVMHHPFQEEINHFVDCIQENRESHASVADCYKSHEICLAGDLSAAEGRAVRLPLKC